MIPGKLEVELRTPPLGGAKFPFARDPPECRFSAVSDTRLVTVIGLGAIRLQLERQIVLEATMPMTRPGGGKM
jgi:hypothetical protein